MVVMSAVVFAGIYMVGDPVSMLASPEATEAQRSAIRAALDKVALGLLDDHARHCLVGGHGGHGGPTEPDEQVDELMGAVGRLLSR